MTTERTTDYLISDMLTAAGIDFAPNGSKIKEIEEALKTASKRGTGKQGFPEFTAKSGDFILVIEDKRSPDRQAKYIGDKKDVLLMDTPSVNDYAENGALHYALNIIEKTNFKQVIAFGCSGVERGRLNIRPIFVNPSGYQIMPMERDFSAFTAAEIDRYFREKICQNESLEKVELKEILKRAENLHEDLRNYGQLSDQEKPLVVSAILLALNEKGFSTEDLIGDTVKTDGQKIFEALSTHMDRVHVAPPTKKSQVLDQFRLIVNRSHLSMVNPYLGKSPLRYFAEYLNSNIITAIVNNTPEDVLGRFYGEFIRYSGGAGQTLGVVLTPKHITELFVDLAEITPNDIVFDPCCGTGGFLIAAMHRMLSAASDAQKKKIKQRHIHGIEMRDDMFSIATTNMILRGDGKSNLICGDFFQTDLKELREKHFTVGLMNPPYSQAKNKATAHLSELRFISRLLDSLDGGARCVVIVPQSAMVGKSKEDKTEKQYIYNHHTLEGVITLNPQTFYGVGTNPVIAVFTAHQPHPANKLAKFVNFKDDGYEVAPHLGLLPTEIAPARKQLLLDCWQQGQTAPSSFIVRTTISPEDEWLHSFYYFNEEPPSEEDFEKTMADYLSFEFSMIAHGRGYLFETEQENNEI